MSKGLSAQQLKILGLAVAVSRYRNGAPIPRIAEHNAEWRVPIVTGVWPDLTCGIAAHVIGGLCLRRRTSDNWQVWLETTPAGNSIRSSLSRATTLLMKRGLLAYRPYVYLGDHADNLYGSGAVLTADGLRIGLPHEPHIPDLDYRLWLLNDAKKWWGAEQPPDEWWKDPAPEILLPPVWQEVRAAA